jgi:hypothetical protein
MSEWKEYKFDLLEAGIREKLAWIGVEVKY